MYEELVNDVKPKPKRKKFTCDVKLENCVETK